MDLHQALRERRTVHTFAPTPVPRETVERAIESALLVPNHRMTEPWGFSWPGPQTRQAIFEVGCALKSPDRPLDDAGRAQLAEKFLTPPELLVLRQKLAARPDVRQEDYASVACAAFAIMLALWSEGIGAKWSTGAVTVAPDTYRLLGVDPQNEAIVGFLWIGYADTEARETKPPRRRALDACVSRLP
jgi:nitroreductase